MQRESVDVTWGEGTYDEMCMLYMSILTPYTPPETLSCAMGEQCLAECAAEGRSTSDCLIGCPMPVTCKGCLLQSIIGCGGAVCLGSICWDNSSGDGLWSTATNWTLGLPWLRTSVDHGTAFGIAGQGRADHRPLSRVVETTLEMLQGRLPRKRPATTPPSPSTPRGSSAGGS